MRKQHSARFKFQIALAAIKGDLTIEEICQENEVAASSVHKWKKQLLESGAEAFNKDKKGNSKGASKDKKIAKLYEKIGRLTVERDFLKKNWEQCESQDG